MGWSAEITWMASNDVLKLFAFCLSPDIRIRAVRASANFRAKQLLCVSRIRNSVSAPTPGVYLVLPGTALSGITVQ